MKRWTSLSAINEDQRWQELSRALTAAGAANEFVPYTGALDPFEDMAGLERFHHVRIGGRVGLSILKNIKVQSSWTTLLGVTDGMVKSHGAWWPLCALYESFGQVLVGLGQNLDMRGSVLVAGAGSAARVAVAGFFKAGFKNFLMTNFSSEEAEETMRELRAKFFGLTLQWVPMDRIILLPGESSVLVNCTPSVEDNELLRELSYLNFLKRSGFLFDMSRGAKTSILVQEANDAGVTVIPGVELAARSDVLWAKWAFGVDLDLEAYKKTMAEPEPEAASGPASGAAPKDLGPKPE